MRFLRVTLALLAALVALCGPSPSYLHAWRYSSDLGGGGYCQCKTCPAIAPATLFALITLGAIIALAIKTEHGHSNSHSDIHEH